MDYVEKRSFPYEHVETNNLECFGLDVDDKLLSEEGVLKAETDNAQYLLHPNFHKNISNLSDVILNEADAMILETGPYRYSEWNLNNLSNVSQYSNIVEDFLDQEPRPIYNVDIDYDENIFALEKFTPGPVISRVSGHVANKGIMMDFCSKLQVLNFHSSAGLRSAFMAEKSDKMVSKDLIDEFDRKPTIFMEFGAGHLDIKKYLEDENLRSNILSLHEKINFGHLRNNQIGKICKYEFTEGAGNQLGNLEYKKIIYEADEDFQ